MAMGSALDADAEADAVGPGAGLVFFSQPQTAPQLARVTMLVAIAMCLNRVTASCPSCSLGAETIALGVRLLLGSTESTCKRRAQRFHSSGLEPGTSRTSFFRSDLGLRDSLAAAVTGSQVTSMDSAARKARSLAVWVWLLALPAMGTAPSCQKSEGDLAPAASSDPQPAPTQPGNPSFTIAGREQTHSVGQTAESTDYVLTVPNVKECPVEPHLEPKQGNVKLGVEVTIEGTGTREVPVNPFYATVSDSNGNQYKCTFGGCEPPLESSRIRKGDRAQGWITFELPKQATGLTLSYSPFVIGTGKQTVRFELGR